MSERRNPDALITEWLELEATGRAPDGLFERVFATTAGSPQRRAWPRWLPRQSFPGARGARGVGLLLAAALVALILIFGGLLAGARLAVVQPTRSPSAPPPPTTIPSPRPVQALASITVGVSTGSGGLVASDGTTLWVSTNAAIVGIDPVTSTIRTRIIVPPTAYSSAITASSGAIWLDAPDAQPLSVSRYDTKTGALAASVPVRDALGPLAAAGAIWVAEASVGAVVRIDPGTNKVVATIATGGTSLGDLTAGPGDIWVVDVGDSTIVELDPTTNKVVATVTITGSPSLDGALTVGTGAFWLSGNGNPVTRIDAPGGQTASTATALGESIGNALVHPDAVWCGFAPGTAPSTGILLGLDPSSGLPIDALSIPEGQVTAVAEAFGSVWLVLGQQGLVERFSPDVLTVTR